ncbi:MAG: hypothetical protein ACR2KO_12490 [Geodermatophilaceae bacterium]
MRGRLLGLLLMSALLSGCGVVGEDPLGVGGGERGGTTGFNAATIGQQVVFGSTVLTNGTAEDATLLAARLVPTGATGGADPVAVFAVNTLDSPMVAAGVWGTDVDYPETILHPVGGYRLTPNSSVQLLVLIDVKDTGRWEFAGLEVTYTHSGWFYSELAANEFILCVDEAGDCLPFQ